MLLLLPSLLLLLLLVRMLRRGLCGVQEIPLPPPLLAAPQLLQLGVWDGRRGGGHPGMQLLGSFFLQPHLSFPAGICGTPSRGRISLQLGDTGGQLSHLVLGRTLGRGLGGVLGHALGLGPVGRCL